MKQLALIFVIAFALSACATTRFEQPAPRPMVVKAKPAGVAPVSVAPQPATPAPKAKPKKKKRWWAPWRKG